MSAAVTLKLDIHDYWHPGTGRGRGAGADAIVHRASHGLPELPGRSLRGLLREALREAAQYGWLDEFDAEGDPVETLFGTRDTQAGQRSHPGSLRVDSARLPDELACWLALPEQIAQRNLLYRTVYSTAIDAHGSARDGSLRSQEVIVPLTLYARIEALPDAPAPERWQAMLERALPLIDAVGSKRRRGLGRATLTLENAA